MGAVSLVFPEATHQDFARNVLPMVRARDVREQHESGQGALARDLATPERECWPLTLTRPMAGRVYSVTAGRRSSYLLDTVIEWTGKRPEPGKDVCVRVAEVSGERSTCAVTDDPVDRLEHEDWPAAMLVGAHASHLVALLPESDTLWAWMCWPHERVPIRYSMQRPRYDMPRLRLDLTAIVLGGNNRLVTSCPRCCFHLHGKTCELCGKAGFVPVRWYPEKSRLTIQLSRQGNRALDPLAGKTASVSPVSVWWQNVQGGEGTALPANGKQALAAIHAWGQRDTSTLSVYDTAAVSDHQRRIRAFDDLLERMLQAQGERATGPVPFTLPAHALQESARDVVYRLALGRSANFDDPEGMSPFPRGSDLIFLRGPYESQSLALTLRWQEGVVPADQPPPTAKLLRSGVADGSLYVDVRFPRGIDVSSIPVVGYLTADRPRPAERLQQEEVRRWVRPSNMFNPVLNAMVTPRPVGSLPPAPSLKNQGISRNAAQLDAVRLGLSDEPLALIKGPPGTGKTTVIVELILQSAERGHKVLLCSQTHQAVRNVLERLDERGDVRMYRHGRDQKLSDVERKYSQGGSSMASTEGTLKRATDRARAAKEAYEREATDVLAYAEAIGALERLDRLNLDRARRLEQSEAQDRSDRAAAERRHRESDTAATTRHSGTRAQIENSDRTAIAERDASQVGLRLLAERMAILGGSVAVDAASEPLDAAAPPGLLRERLRMSAHAVAQHEQRLGDLLDQIRALDTQVREANSALHQSRAQAHAAHAELCAVAGRERDNELADTQGQYQAALQSAAAERRTAHDQHEAPLLARQASALQALTNARAHEADVHTRMRGIDAQLEQYRRTVLTFAGREPHLQAPRAGFFARTFAPGSLEVAEGEWAFLSAHRAETDYGRREAAMRVRDAGERHGHATAQLASMCKSLDERQQHAVDAAFARHNVRTKEAHERHEGTLARGQRSLAAAEERASREYQHAVGDAPMRLADLGPLRDREQSLVGWWTQRYDSLRAVGADSRGLGKEVESALVGRTILAPDRACDPTEQDLRVAEVTSAIRMLQGIVRSAESQQEQNRKALTRSDSELAGELSASTTSLLNELSHLDEMRLLRDQAIDGSLRPEYDACQAVLHAACHAASSHGIMASPDDTREQWQQRIDAREPVVGPLRSRMEFTGRWVGDLGKSDGVLARLHWDHVDVFLSTCLGVSAWKLLNDDGPDAVDLVIIDEAAHATLPEVLAPMRFGRRTILIGDEMQLPPIASLDTKEFQPSGDWLPDERMDDVPSSSLVAMSDNWMQRSLFEWLYLRRQAIPRVMLDVQFRMHPHIGEFISQVFYEGKLHNGVPAAERELPFGDFQSAVCVVSTSQHKSDRHERRVATPGTGTPSFSNPAEAEIVLRILQQASDSLSRPASFGIITPYAAQKFLLQDRISPVMSELRNVDLDPHADIGSVDSYQGSERDCIIVSLVRSPADCHRCHGSGSLNKSECLKCGGRGFHAADLTFARDLRRLNVAFSRARCSLIVIGDFDRLCDTSIKGSQQGGKVLKLFSDHVLNRGGLVLHVWEKGPHDR